MYICKHVYICMYTYKNIQYTSTHRFIFPSLFQQQQELAADLGTQLFCCSRFIHIHIHVRIYILNEIYMH